MNRIKRVGTIDIGDENDGVFGVGGATDIGAEAAELFDMAGATGGV